MPKLIMTFYYSEERKKKGGEIDLLDLKHRK